MPVPTVHIFEIGDYEAQIKRAAEHLGNGEVVVLPTETVYGAAAMLQKPEAIATLRTLRGTDDNKPFTIHLARSAQAFDYLGDVSELGKRLIRKLWPGPVALQFDVPAARRAEVAASLGLAESDLYESGSITLRCPDHIVATDVIGRVPGPVVATAVAPPAAAAPDADATEALDGRVALVLDAGATSYSKASTMLRVHPDRYELVRVGVYDERIIERLLRTTVLFVCSGNTCRSPMAEALGRIELGRMLGVGAEELEKKGVSVLSAGSFAMPGARATPAAAEAVKELGGDLSRHRSRPLSVELIHQADVIFTMGRSHLQAVTGLVPGATEKAFTLDPQKDIEDPIGGDVALYRELAGRLKDLIGERLKEKVQF